MTTDVSHLINHRPTHDIAWVDWSQVVGESAEVALDHALGILNTGRSRILSAFGGLVIVLPRSFESRVANTAVDLWSVRTFAMRLPPAQGYAPRADGEVGRLAGARWRIFLSYTSELREFPREGSYVAAVERAISAAGHVIVDMADFPAADQPPAQLCMDRVRICDVYMGVLGTRYGSPVRDKPEVSYTELEFDTATEAGLPRLMFLLDSDADVGIPPSELIDHQFSTRQDAFRRRVQDSGLVTGSFANPDMLGRLVERSLRELAETLRAGSETGREQVRGLVVVGEIPQEPLGFQLRADLLAALDAPGSQSIVPYVLTGMRGVGKTHLAAAYARSRILAGWRLVAWVNAEDSATVLGGLAAVATALGLDAGSGDAQAASTAVRQWLETDGDRCLVVFDNASDPQDLLPCLPAAGQAKVLITSNEKSVTSLGTGVVVDVFTEAEALAFLAGQTGSADSEGARQVAIELGRLPLALAQAAAVIATQHLDYPTFLDQLRAAPVQDAERAVVGQPYPYGVAEAIVLAIKAAADGDQTGLRRGLINVVALLSSAGVSRELLYAAGDQGLLQPPGAGDQAEPDQIDQALAWLGRAALLTFSVDGATVSAHLLTMRVAVERQAGDGSLAALGAGIAKLLSVVTESLADPVRNRPAARDAVQQIMALHEHLAPYLGEQDTTLIETLLRLRGWAVWCLDELGDSSAQAIQFGQALVTDAERVLGDTHPDTMTARNNLAGAYWAAGRPGEAIPLYEQVLADRERVLGPDHPGTLISRSNLAGAYQDAGRIGEAIPLYEQVLADRERVLGPDDPGTLISRSNLAGAYRAAGRIGEAIPLYEQVLADRERVLGPDHPDTMTSRNDLAGAYWDAGRTGEAIPLYEQVLADRERVLGPDHPGTLISRSNLASVYRAAGRIEEAIPLYEQALADRERVLGPDHPDTLISRSNLAGAYWAAGRPGEAIPLYEQALASFERVFGPTHSYTLITRSNLAGAYRAAGRIEEAIPLYEQALADRERVLGPGHPDTMTSRNNLASAYQEAGRIGEAIPLYEQVLADRERVLGRDHPDTLISRSNLAGAYWAAGRIGEAIPLYEQALASSERVFGPDHPNSRGLRTSLERAQSGADSD